MKWTIAFLVGVMVGGLIGVLGMRAWWRPNDLVASGSPPATTRAATQASPHGEPASRADAAMTLEDARERVCDPDEYIRQTAITRLQTEIHRATELPLPSDEIARTRLGVILREIWDAYPAGRPELLERAPRLGGCLATPIMIGAIVGDDPALAQAGQRHLQRLLDRSETRQPAIDALAQVAVAGEPKRFEAAAKWLDQVGGRGQTIAEALYALARGRGGALRVLKLWGEERAPHVRLAAALGTVPVEAWPALWQRFEMGPHADNGLLKAMLCHDDRRVREAGVQVLTEGRDIFDGAYVLAGVVATRAMAPGGSGDFIRDEWLEWKEMDAALRMLLGSDDDTARRSALVVLPRLPVRSAAIEAELQRMLRNRRDSSLRRMAAVALRGERAEALARLPQMVDEVRAKDLAARAHAARRIQSSGTIDEATGAALVRATDRGDMAAREGLLRAIEQGFYDDRPVSEVLRDTMNSSEAESRACASAAIRELRDNR